jgi:hypothetical protein
VRVDHSTALGLSEGPGVGEKHFCSTNSTRPLGDAFEGTIAKLKFRDVGLSRWGIYMWLLEWRGSPKDSVSVKRCGRAQGSEFRVGFRVSGSGFCCLVFRVWGLE